MVAADLPIDFVAVTWHTRTARSTRLMMRTGTLSRTAPFASAGMMRGASGSISMKTAPRPLAMGSAALSPVGDAEAYQIRGIPARAAAPKVMAINTTDGPFVSVASRLQGEADALSNCVFRAE